jgi:predicted transcriptional regulator of viral defense system
MRSSEFFASHPVFTHEEYLAAREAGGDRSPRTADSLLLRHAARGHLLRVRRGLYASVPVGTVPEAFLVDPYLLATKLALDAVVAYHAALQFRGKTYSVWQRLAVLTRSHMRAFVFQDSEFTAVRPPRVLAGLPEHGGGVVSEPHAGGMVRVTTFERTLVDVLDAPELGGGWEEVWRSLEMVEYFDLAAVVEHTLRRSSALTAARVGFYLEQHREELFVEEEHLEALRERAPRQARYLDRTREPGRLVKPWNLVVPERVLHRTWAEVA